MSAARPIARDVCAGWRPQGLLINRNVTASAGRTSMRLEPEIWHALAEVCQRERLTLGELVRAIEVENTGPNLSSAVRVFALHYFRAAVTEPGHRAAGHGSLPL